MGARVASLITLALAGCGRIGFGTSGDPTAADAEVPFVEARGVLDPTFGTGGTTITSDAGRTVELFSIVPRAGGYLAVGVHEGAAGMNIGLVGYLPDGSHDPGFDGDGLADVGPTTGDFGYGARRIDATRILINGDGDDAASSTKDDMTLGVIDDHGVLDPSFGSGGFVRIDFQGLERADTANRVAIVDGTVIACGVSGYNATDAKFALVRVDLTGALVTSWGANGSISDDFMPGVQDECNDVTSTDGRVIAAGTSAYERLVIVAYDAMTGARDPTFATGGVFMTGTGTGGNAFAVALADGDIIAAGLNRNGAIVVRLEPDGSPRAGFGVNGVLELPAIADFFTDVVVQPNGKLLVAGALGDAGIVARLLPDGGLDAGFGVGGVVTLAITARLSLTKLSLDPGGAIMVVGTTGASTPYAGLAARIE